MSILPHNVTPKMVIGGTLGLIAVAIGVRVWSQSEDGGESGMQMEQPSRENARGEYGHKHGHHGRHRHHRDEE